MSFILLVFALPLASAVDSAERSFPLALYFSWHVAHAGSFFVAALVEPGLLGGGVASAAFSGAEPAAAGAEVASAADADSAAPASSPAAALAAGPVSAGFPPPKIPHAPSVTANRPPAAPPTQTRETTWGRVECAI